MKFVLSDNIYKNNIAVLKKQQLILEGITKKAGTSNPKFEIALEKLFVHLTSNLFGRYRMDNRFDLRALAIALNESRKLRSKINITKSILDSVAVIAPKGSSLFNDALFQYFLNDFDEIEDLDFVGQWLINERQKKGQGHMYDKFILTSNGPRILAKDAIKNKLTFQKQMQRAEVNNYASGQFLKRALSIYYVEQLSSIPVNQPHTLLDEVSVPEVFNAKYDDDDLIGHKVLKILLERAPKQNVHESWQNTIIAIAGDPRISKSHPRFLKWWSHVPEDMIKKVRSWLSRLDLKLFLDALENFSKSSLDTEMKRMFPSRKKFLEGMHDAGVISHTKLYLSKQADRYIKQNYKPEHVPEYSIVEDGDRSIIYAELTTGHMIEGSHNCQIWLYRNLHESAQVMQPGAQRVSYRSLTMGLDEKMSRYNCAAYDHFTHSPNNFSWQRRSVTSLREIGLKIRAVDVLVASDYKAYKRIHGVS
jgi:hypothetical protein